MAGKYSGKLKPKAAAEYIEVPQSTLDYWRWIGKGPIYLKLEGGIYYLPSDLDEFLRSCRRVPAQTAEAR